MNTITKLDRTKHRNIMKNILIDFYKDFNIWTKIVFKWWTASYFFYDLDRFSTDLDFDFIWNYENIDDKIISILEKYWKIKKTWRNLTLSYWNRDVNIKIDISRNIWKNNIYEINNFYWVDIKTQDKSTIFGNKLVALTERNTNRDIYDVYFFLEKSFPINEKLIFERTGKNKKELFLQIIEKLKKLPKNYKILDWLWDVLDNNQKAFVKNKLIKKLIWMLEFKIDFE